MPNKYGARQVERDGYTFASRAEAARYEELRLLLLAGEITTLVVHPRFALYSAVLRDDDGPTVCADEAPATLQLCDGEYGPCCYARRIGYYTADFTYEQGGRVVVDDVKGGKATRTEAYRLRKKLVEAMYRLEVREVG